MNWYLVLTKPRQEKRAFDNLTKQGYECYLPTLPTEKVRRGALALQDEPLFPRYLFILLGQDGSSKSWMPVRSTKGVSRLVTFGARPAKVNDCLIEGLRSCEVSKQHDVKRLFQRGERVLLTKAPFAGIEAIYQMTDGDSRAMVLIEMLSRQVSMEVQLASLRKVG
jgi:transcriptional antiterminator RfaH